MRHNDSDHPVAGERLTMSENELPQLGVHRIVMPDQWWFRTDGSRVRIIGWMTDGRVCYEDWGFAWTCDESEIMKMRHEPRCDGFQWRGDTIEA